MNDAEIGNELARLKRLEAEVAQLRKQAGVECAAKIEARALLAEAMGLLKEATHPRQMTIAFDERCAALIRRYEETK